jgi:hypothetical protein
MASVLDRLRCGEDVLRLIKTVQLNYQLTQFASLSTEDRTTHVANWCEVLLTKKKDTDVCRSRSKAIAELAGARIPEDCIRLRAYSRWQQNGHRASRAETDWYEALAELRAEYQEHYMKHCFRVG